MANVVLAMSGGVDSSVAAKLLQKQGHDVVGVFMRHGEETLCKTGNSQGSPTSGTLPILPVGTATGRGTQQGCCTAADAEDARRVADQLEIPFYAVDFQEEFQRITEYFVDEYVAGRTPNPCVVCNQWIKFGRLFDYADSIGAEFVATGHYARIMSAKGELGLYRGRDPDKDQSYVLFGIECDRLRRMLLPVGGFQKSQIRELAADLGLRVAYKKDSQEICFVSAGQHADFVAARRGRDTRGVIADMEGNVVGHHDGIERFTIGQRKGLGIALGEPVYVVRIDARTCTVVVGRHADLQQQCLAARGANWIVPSLPEQFPAFAQIRYNSRAQSAVITRHGDDSFDVRFDEPVSGVAPGQAVVCYDQDRVLGGGWIATAGPEKN